MKEQNLLDATEIAPARAAAATPSPDAETAPAPLRAKPNSHCFVCGETNSSGLHLHFRQTGSSEMVADWNPGSACEGFLGIVHGGLVSTVLDEAMSKAVVATRIEALTVELRVRLRRNLDPMQTFHVRGWVNSQKRRLIQTEATMTSPEGIEYAHAWGTFLTIHGGATQPAAESTSWTTPLPE